MPKPTRPKPALGDCFAASGKFIREQPATGDRKDYRLVHGNLAQLRQDAAVNHAWVEHGDVVHEVSNGQMKVFAKELYYKTNGVTTVRNYTWEEALVLMIRHEHWGPWD